VDGRYGGPPIAPVDNEVGPKLASGESWWNYDACARS
jgi:hypothetical protein